MRQSILTMAVCAAVLCGGTARARGQCVGDCSGSGAVAVNDLITMVNIALGNSDVAACRAGDADGGGTITINEIIAAVNNDLNGCPPEPTNSPAGVGTPTSTPTARLTPTQTAPPTPCTGRFCDNGDGTIADTQTGLMWEKKDSSAGIHNKDTTYTWSTTGTAADGTAFTDFLVKLNTPPCFAGHCDWRLPSEEGQNPPGTGPNELESIVDTGVTGCGPSPSPACVAPAFDTNCQTGCSVDGAGNTPTCSCTQSSLYWSGTTLSGIPTEALLVYFGNAPVQHTTKTVAVSVRAVRCANQAGCPPEPTHSPAPTVTPTSTATSTQTAPGSPASTGSATATSTPTPTPTQTATPTLSTSHDNGDGTITDTNTGLMWEKKDDAGGIHDKDKLYTWSTTGTAEDGTAFTDFLATLNTPPCFAAHCDWRLPKSGGVPAGSSGEPAELESILAAPSPCTGLADPCVPPVFNTDCKPDCTLTGCSCTQTDSYWSATTVAGNPGSVWFVHFGNGAVRDDIKTFGFYVRAVRGGFAGPTPTATLTRTPTPTPTAMSRFLDNGDGTITDNNTGLMWEKKDSSIGIHNKDTTYTWSNTGTAADGTAFTDFLVKLNTPPCFAAHCDWRLPNSGGTAGSPSGEPAELESILTVPPPCTGPSHPCVPPVFNTGCTPGCTVTDCSCTQSNWYWSATPDAGGPLGAWIVPFNDFFVGTTAKTAPNSVRAVRRAVACTSRFCDSGDGTVTDNQTGLMWEKKSDDGGIHDKDRTFSWSITGTAADGTAFTNFLATLNSTCFAAHCDWRLPKSGGTAGSPSGEPAELESILAAPSPCTGLADPCVPPIFNTGCTSGCTVTGCSCTQSNYYWSATNGSVGPDYAWQVFFNNGAVINGAKAFNNNPLSHNVRAVRSGP